MDRYTNPGLGAASNLPKSPLVTSPSHTPSSHTPPPKSIRTASGSPTFTTSSTKPTAHPSSNTNVSNHKSAASPTPVQTNDPGVSVAATAGIAVACAIIGAVLAGFIAYFIMRRSKRRYDRSMDRDQPAPVAGRYSGSGSDAVGGSAWMNEREKKQEALIASPQRSPIGMPALENMLPQPVDTTYLNSELSTLQALTRNHISNFFHTNPIQPDILAYSIDRGALVETAMDSPFSPDEWINLLASTKTRMDAVRFILGWVIFRRLEPECEPTKTLLPPGMTACYRHILEYSDTRKASEYLQSKWRVVTGYLLRDQYVGRAFGTGDDRLPNLKSTNDLLDGVLYPLGREELNAARTDNMNEILKRAASVGFVLASQPNAWIFDWEPPGQGQHPKPLVVFPSLIQHTSGQPQDAGDGVEVGSKEVGNSILISQ